MGTDGGGAAGAPQPLPNLVGWASVPECGPSGEGTTGGLGGPTVFPRTASELNEAVRDAGPSVIQISGTIDLGDTTLQVSSDKTLIGVEGAELVGSVRVLDARNVILSNIRFNGGPVQLTSDAVELSGATCVWLDHCEFFDGGDGNLDIVRGSDLITVSWSKFYYESKTDPHRLSNLCGNTDSDTPGKIRVTFHHNWWGAGVLQQMPRVRHGQVHVFNNYFNSAGNNYCIGAGYMARLLVQNNLFDGVANPIVFQLDEVPADSGLHTAEVLEVGNDYSNATGEHVSRGSAFVPPYTYTLEPAADTGTAVVAGSGVQ